MSPAEIRDLWGDPRDLSPEDLKAFHEWCQCWDADDSQYQAYYRRRLAEEQEGEIAGEMVEATAYVCDSEGSDSTVGTHVSRQVAADLDDRGFTDVASWDYPRALDRQFAELLPPPPRGAFRAQWLSRNPKDLRDHVAHARSGGTKPSRAPNSMPPPLLW